MKVFALYLAVLTLVYGIVWQAKALGIEHIVNGGFETGDFTGWIVKNSGWLGDWYINNGTFDPFGPSDALPPGGNS